MAKKRCSSWCRQFRLADTLSSEISPDLKQTFVKTRGVLTGMIQYCLDYGYKPILVVAPVSKAMNECLSEEFLQKVLFDNIRLSNKQEVLFLNYLKDQRFQDISLYADNADFLNVKGRRLFTEILVDDVTKFNDENRNTHISP